MPNVDLLHVHVGVTVLICTRMESSRTGFLARITAMTAGLIRAISSALITISLLRVSCLPGACRSSSPFLMVRRTLSEIPSIAAALGPGAESL